MMSVLFLESLKSCNLVSEVESGVKTKHGGAFVGSSSGSDPGD